MASQLPLPVFSTKQLRNGQELLFRGYKVYLCSHMLIPGNGPGRVINMLQFAARVKGCLPGGYRPDVVIASSVHPFSWRAGDRIARKANAPLLLSPGSMAPDPYRYGRNRRQKHNRLVLQAGKARL